jgi:hypothetical protein
MAPSQSVLSLLSAPSVSMRLLLVVKVNHLPLSAVFFGEFPPRLCAPAQKIEI